MDTSNDIKTRFSKILISILIEKLVVLITCWSPLSEINFEASLDPLPGLSLAQRPPPHNTPHPKKEKNKCVFIL